MWVQGLARKCYREYISERDISPKFLDALLDFDAKTWNLQTAEVRTDRGKLVNSTWKKVIDGHHHWITIGIGNYVKTIVDRTTSGMDKCVRSGDLYDFVERVNAELITAEGVTLPNETREYDRGAVGER